MLDENLTTKRAGSFCASENHRLMAGWDAPMTPRNYPEFEELYGAMKSLDAKPLVGEIKKRVSCDVSGALINQTWKIIQEEKPPAGLVTYAEEVANEKYYSRDPRLNFSTPHTENGNEREASCISMLAEKTGVDFINTGESQSHINIDGVGCTPDGIVLDRFDLISAGAEAKCKSPLVHTRNMLVRNNKDLIETAFDAFVQIQTGMLITGADHWYFANYNPHASYESMRFGYIIVERDDRFISILENRINVAKKIRDAFIAKIESGLGPFNNEVLEEA